MHIGTYIYMFEEGFQLSFFFKNIYFQNIYYDVYLWLLEMKSTASLSQYINVRDIHHQISTDSLGINWSAKYKSSSYICTAIVNTLT